ncbi:hypothetical protein EDB89DRAFT_2001872 [Lactarius sanguifluus]|nr:hypothetical protein EDB89DRAFT_2001872 [Lactarius sanguifluus]
MEQLSRWLSAGSLLIHSEKGGPATDLRAVLLARLAQYRAQRGLPERDDGDPSLEQAQEETAQEALSVVESVQRILDEDASPIPAVFEGDTPGGGPMIGTRDISQLRTLLSIVFKWGTEPLLAHVNIVWPAKGYTQTQLIDANDVPHSYERLTAMTRQLLSLLFPRGVQGTLPQTLITSTLLHRHVTDILRPAIALGWVPKALFSESFPVVDNFRPLVIRLLSILPPSQTIASLGAIMSSSPPPPQHVHKSCASLLSRQLMRPDGVRGLLAAVFGEGESEQAPLEKLLHVSLVLGAVPSTVSAEDYFRSVVSCLVELLKARVSLAYIRAASFSLSRMITAEGNARYHSLVSSLLLSLLRDPILIITPELSTSEESKALTPVEAIQVIQTFLTNTDPAPSLVSTVLSPIVTSLYALLGTLARTKTADPTLRESVRGLLVAWGRMVPTDEAVAILWACVNGQGGEWAIDTDGGVRRVEKPEKEPSLALFTPDDLKRAEESGALDVDANFLGLRPDPVHFVAFLQSLDRPDAASEIFVLLLEGYRELKSDSDGDSLRTLLFLQLIVQVQTQMSKDGPSSSNILSKPDHVFSFIKHALQSDTTLQSPEPKTGPKKPSVHQWMTMNDLRIVPKEEQEDDSDMGDSDDETPNQEGAQPNSEMTTTALNLLLSVLEANPNLSAQSAPVLNEILEDVERLTKAPSEPVRALAREARMVLTVRLASASTAPSGPAQEPEEEQIRSIYQRALKLLQDALLPVRAHGLLLLRELVTTRAGTPPHEVVRALEPAIRDVFLQAVQDDDSYIFLNAVQGLATLADSFGSEALGGLVGVYAGGLQGVGAGALTQQDVDMRLRVGEALGQVIRGCGETLPRYADVLVPRLFALVRSSHLPTTIRTSSLSLLATCADTADLALLPYAHDLANAMLDLLQVEGGASARAADANRPPTEAASMDTQPTAADAGFPPFRRASLHFLGVVVRAYMRRATASSPSGVGTDSRGHILPDDDDFPTRRATATLGYVAATDADAVVRVMAREVGEAVRALERAGVGL